VGNTFYLFRNIRLYALVDYKRGYLVGNNNEEIRCLGLAGAPLCRANYYPLEYDPVYLAERASPALAQGTVDQYYEKGDFAKLRELSITYSLPDGLMRGVTHASLTLAGRDLHTWTSYPGLDPEASVNTVATSYFTADQGLTPPLTRYIATIHLTF
jgi:hypothetical protein